VELQRPFPYPNRGFVIQFIPMRALLALSLGLGLAALAGCASYPSDRIASHQADFNSWPPDVQIRLRAGTIAQGDTPEQVFIALGDPDAKSVTSYPGALVEVWTYRHLATRLSVGVGGSSYNGSTAVAGGASANGIPLGRDIFGQVIFTNGRVTQAHITTR
jgi:hypothetical protein